MKPFRINLTLAWLVAAVLTVLPLSGQTFLDKFLDEDIIDLLNHPTGSARTSDLSGLANVLGGERRFTETRLATLPGGSGAALSHGATIEAGVGFNFLNGNNSRNEILLQYGLSNPVKFDFSAFAAGGSLRLVDWFSDQPNVQLELTLRSNVGTGLASSQSNTITLPVSPFPLTTSVDFAFALYDQIDFANIDDISLKFTAQTFATDAGATALMVQIPEPGTYALLMGLVSFGLIQLRRRRLV